MRDTQHLVLISMRNTERQPQLLRGAAYRSLVYAATESKLPVSPR